MRNLFKWVRTYIIITLGLFLHALGWTAFLIPAEITGGGITGVATLIYYASGFPIGLSYFVINSFFLLISFRLLGIGFGIKTIVAVALLSFILGLLQQIITEPVVHDTFLSTVIGGMLAGAGVGVVFTQGGSTGGTDNIAMIINKYKNITPGRIILYLDLIIISSSYFIFGSIEKIVYGYVTMAVVAYAIDMVLSGSKQTYQLFVFSPKYEEIANNIAENVKRGITLIDAEGWYTKQKTKIVMVMIRKHETNDILKIVKKIDPDAFVSQNNVMGVYGKGFDVLKH